MGTCSSIDTQYLKAYFTNHYKCNCLKTTLTATIIILKAPV